MSQPENEQPLQQDAFDYCFKVVLIGDSSSGKSQLLKRLINDEYTYTYATRGVDFKSRVFTLDRSTVRVCLKFFDTSGLPEYLPVTLSYLLYVQAYLVFYDITNEASFQNCQNWLNEINNYKSLYGPVGGGGEGRESSNGRDDLIKVLIGCKRDLVKEDSGSGKSQAALGQVATRKARDFARKNGFLFFYETSAKENLNLTLLFDDLCLELVKNYLNYLNDVISEFQLSDSECVANLNKSIYFSHTNMSLSAVTATENVYFNCQTEALNCDHLLLNHVNARRKNLQEIKPSFLESFFGNL
jgi:GTPase SAR1 family protein